MDYTYIDRAGKLAAYLHDLKKAGKDTIALDLEGEFNLHQYGEKLCLVQVYDGKDAVIIDPFKVQMHHIKRFFENRSILKIMFDASGDRAFMYKNYGIDLLSLLDLQEAVDLLEHEKSDLKSVLKKVLKIDGGMSKKKLQRYNWTRRPIESGAIEYAIKDVLYLFDLKDRLLPEIIKRGLLDQFILRNLQAQNKPHVYGNTPKLFESGKFRSLIKDKQRIFKRLFEIRERYAKNLNLPPNSVFPNDLLFELVEGGTRARDIKFGKRVPERVRKRIIEDMEKAIWGSGR
ncbi:MAG: HRDC domain-containing protein [Spirochaetes bacterium]|nr:HRDC domain-containing protein [Spirochaetota bacterium]